MKDRESIIKRDRFLTETLGKCYHDWEPCWAKPSRCTKCKREMQSHEGYGDNNFSSWENFGKLWEWANEQPWWNEFWVKNAKHIQTIIDPTYFADSMYKFLDKK